MKILNQNHHGLPGMGVNGKIGEMGEKGNSVYFGFINDFFDGETINVSTYVYIAKRLLDENNEHADASLIDNTIKTAWNVTQAEIAQYDINDSFKTYVEQVSNNTYPDSRGKMNAPYVNYKTFYYSGNRLNSPEMLSNLDPNIDASTLDNASSIQLDINGDFISMSFMISTLNGNNDNDINKQYEFKYDKTPTIDLQYDTSNRMDKLYEYIDFSVSHYEFENLAGLVLNATSPFTNSRCQWTYDSNDVVYAGNPNSGIDIETGEFFNNMSQNSSYISNVNGLPYVAEDLKIIINGRHKEIATDEQNYFASIPELTNSSTYTFATYQKQYIAHSSAIDPLNNWQTVYKISSPNNNKINNKFISKNNLYKKGDLYDYKDRSFYGIPPRLLFTDRDNLNELTKINDNISFKNFPSYYVSGKEEAYKNHVEIMLKTNQTSYAGENLHIFYSLDKDDTIIFIPFSLKSYYKPGDVIFFYTNKNTFENTYNIEYMTVVTEDLLNCSPSKFINAAKLQNPLNINLFGKYKDRLSCFFNNAVLYDDISINLRDTSDFDNQHLSDKSYVSIIDDHTSSPALICSNNNFLSIYPNSSIQTLNSTIQNKQFVLNTEIPLKINHLCVNDSKMTNITNVELFKYVYDKNIKFYENKFIKPLLDIDLYYDNSNMGSAVFLNTVLGDDYFYNIETLDNYFYGCNIYNSSMEKIKTITSNEKSFDIEIIPDVNNNVFYIQMFASYGAGSKYYSKLSKLSITYTTFLYSKNVRKMKLAYNNPIGKFSKSKTKSQYDKSVGTYSERQQITAFTIEVIGDEQSILRKKYANNIIFDISDITYEEVNNASLSIYTNNDNINIIDVKFNQIDAKGIIHPNEWSSIEKISDEFVYNIDLSSNLPLYDSSSSSTLREYLALSADTSVTSNSESLLFNNLLNDKNVNNKTKQRSLLVLVKYQFLDSSEYYYENYNIVQPGFEDTRDLPNVELDICNNMIELESINSIDNNVLANQFVTYLNIDIKDFKKQWEKFLNIKELNSITMNCEICNLPYDLEWQEKYFIKQLYNRRTFKTIYESNDVSTLNNYVKFNIDIDKDNTTISDTQIEINTLKTIYDDTFISYAPHILVDKHHPSFNDEYILFDTSLNAKINNKKQIDVGLQNDISIKLNNISLDNDKDNIKIKLSTEFGNPIISNMYYRFYVKNMRIELKFNDETSLIYQTYVPNNTGGSVGSTYLCVINNSNTNVTSVIDFNYKFISESLDVTFSPLSYTICPNDIEKSYTNIYGDLYKYGINEQVIKELKFFNSSVYNSDEYSFDFDTIRKTVNYDYSNLNIKKAYLQDNIKNIHVGPMPLHINDISINEKMSCNIDDQLYNHNVLDFIEGEKYLGLVYHSTIMQPRLRNNKYTFFYNDSEYDRIKYDQKLNNLPVFIHDEQSLELRDDALINSMDKLNDWYAENEQNTNKTYKGVLSLYGNGYTQISENITLKNCMPLSDVIKSNNEIITTMNNYNELDVYQMNNQQPNHNEYFRGFLYDVNWEYPYYNKESIIPYRIVSAFDNVLRNGIEDIQNINTDVDWYNSYYNALIDSSLYGDNMIPYTLLYTIEPRIAYNYDTNKLNVFMLRRPSIGVDTDIIDGNSFKEKYEFNRRLFNLSSEPAKLNSPYIVK